jgi:hypothetical protein
LAYTLAWKEKIGVNHVIGEPVSVQGSDETHVYKLNIGPTLTRGPQQPSDFWVYIKNWGGEWMWEGIEDSQDTKRDLSWLVQGMRSNSLLWVTDGSYDRKRAPTLSGVGWIIFCQHSGKRLIGSFWEKSSSASSYRINKLLNKLSQFLLCTKWIDEGLFDCRDLHHSKVATGLQEHLPDGNVSPFGNNPAKQMSG